MAEMAPEKEEEETGGGKEREGVSAHGRKEKDTDHLLFPPHYTSPSSAGQRRPNHYRT